MGKTLLLDKANMILVEYKLGCFHLLSLCPKEMHTFSHVSFSINLNFSVLLLGLLDDGAAAVAAAGCGCLYFFSSIDVAFILVRAHFCSCSIQILFVHLPHFALKKMIGGEKRTRKRGRAKEVGSERRGERESEW